MVACSRSTSITSWLRFGERNVMMKDVQNIIDNLRELKHLNIFHIEAFFYYLFGDSHTPLSPSLQAPLIGRRAVAEAIFEPELVFEANGEAYAEPRPPLTSALF